ncbi:retroviral-like aspartic protease family protein [Brevundimonas staleyi]|uniref:Retroviral-like aspartic protease family protein n=1 Tax=Brevundimonas staleyi TaxID=74326 RepID=A0ABW0FR84_9CAUL
MLVKIGPTVHVDIGRKSQSAPGEPPDLPGKRIKAMIDTGAGGDCIDERLAEELRLPISSTGIISGVGGTHEALIYTARLYVPALDRLLFQQFTGVKLSEGAQSHRVLLGRTFLRHYRMTYDGFTGQVELSTD